MLASEESGRGAGDSERRAGDAEGKQESMLSPEEKQ
jgi:hypothetical protein